MEHKIISQDILHHFKAYLESEEKSSITIEKYMRDVRAFLLFMQAKPVNKEMVVSYKQHLIDAGYKVRSINSMLASLKSLFTYLGWEDCFVKNIKTQRETYCHEDKELSKSEYMRLVQSAKHKPRLYLLLQTICSTGIRVSELAYFTVEAVKHGDISVTCKNKTRTILIPGKLRKQLLAFAKQQEITNGVIFRTKSGNPLNRSNIWTEMKKLCEKAQVDHKKVFPHNLRKLFARTFYRVEKDIAKLADILGHSSINTTRIYIMTTTLEHRRKIERLHLLV